PHGDMKADCRLLKRMLFDYNSILPACVLSTPVWLIDL
ncbi:hypothetical protein LCGC14_2783090, partial [marine sediment metagenome]